MDTLEIIWKEKYLETFDLPTERFFKFAQNQRITNDSWIVNLLRKDN